LAIPTVDSCGGPKDRVYEMLSRSLERCREIWLVDGSIDDVWRIISKILLLNPMILTASAPLL
jgi:hypothetical protein